MSALPKSIEAAREKLLDLEGQVPHAERRLDIAVGDVAALPELRAERTRVGDALDQDVRLRGRDASIALPAMVSDAIGPAPTSGPERDLWQETAGRLAQHHLAFDLHGSTVAGPTPRTFGHDAYAASDWAAVETVERLDRALGREPEIEPPSRSLGRSL